MLDLSSPIDTLIFAPLAPILGVLLFWFIQILFIESQKYLLSKIWDKHQPLCRFTNLIGILFQTICHALGYTVTRSGISTFYISVDYGRVEPKKEKKGMFEWISNAFLFIGPFFIPPGILLIPILLLTKKTFETAPDAYNTFSQGMIHFGENLFSFSKSFFEFLFTIDLLHPGHLGFLLLLIFLGMGIRPSYIAEEKRREKISMIYDLKNIKNLVLQKPLYPIILLLLSYIIFYISLILEQNWYTTVFSILGWLSITAIVALLIGHMLVLLIKTTDKIPGIWKLLPYITIIVSYITARIIFYLYPMDYSNTISLLTTICSTSLITVFLIKHKTNKFKTDTDMKGRMVEDGTGRTS